MRRPMAILVCAALCATLAIHAAANTPADATTADDPDGKSRGTATESRLVVDVGNSEPTVTARLADKFRFNKDKDDITGRYAMTVTAPFDSKKSDSVDVGTLSGLTAGTSATLEFGVVNAPVREFPQLLEICKEYIEKVLPGYSFDLVKAHGGCRVGYFDQSNIARLIKEVTAKREACSKCVGFKNKDRPLCEVMRSSFEANCTTAATSLDPSCALLDSGARRECAQCKKDLESLDANSCRDLALVERDPALAADAEKFRVKAENELGEFKKALVQPIGIYTVSIKANQQHFDYLLPEDLATAQKADKEGLGITFSYTRVMLRSAWTFAYSHEESYKAADKVQLCTPIGTAGATKCSEATLGAPTKEKAELAYLESRTAFGGGRFGFAPRVEHDFKKSTWAVRLPLYFLANKDKLLTAGFALGYTEAADAEDEFGASVFVSKAFKFY